MTPTRQAAYLALAESRDAASFEAALTALEKTVDRADPNAMVDDDALLYAFCRYARFVARVADLGDYFDTNDPPSNWITDEARKLLGWTSERM